MNIQDLKHKRKNKIKQTLDQIDFRGIDLFFQLAQKIRDLQKKGQKEKSRKRNIYECK